MEIKIELATFGGGCFWCTEAIFESLKGVEKVESGYSGGAKEPQSYSEVSAGKTGHAESIQIQFNPEIISYKTLLEIFFATHDPTTVNKQGSYLGSQYRSIILYHSEKQKELAGKSIKNLSDSGEFGGPIVTEIQPYDGFYKADDSHQDYYKNNPNNPYCTLIISPKLAKLRKRFGKHVKEN